MRELFFALVRHAHYQRRAEVPSAHTPHPLSARGCQQAQGLAARLAETAARRNWVVDPMWHASPLLRAAQSAQIAAKEWNLNRGHQDPPVHVHFHDDLMERSLGSAANLRLGEVEELLHADPRYDAAPPGWRRSMHYRLPLPGAESLAQAGLRVAQFLRHRLIQSSDGSKAGRKTMVVVIAHAGCLRYAAHHLGVLPAGVVSRFSLDFAEPLYIAAKPDGPWRWVEGRCLRLAD